MQTRRSGSKADTADQGTGDGSDSADRYERSSERRGASSKQGRFKRSDKERADAEPFASARRVSDAVLGESVDGARGASGSQTNADDRSARLDQARALLKQATAQPKAPSVSSAPAESASNIDKADFTPFTDPFEEADPFEPFEQCAPAAPAREETVYSRSSQRTRKTSASEANNPRRPQRSLKGRALAFLSRREYSRAELSRKLRPYVEEADLLETLLDSLERDGWLSNERFVESVVHRRASRMGGSRIINELKRHAVGDTLISETADKLAQSETARAQAVWEKKYGVLPETPAERAKQARFLAARGFSGGTIGKILKGGEEDWTDEPIDD
ncbi:MULTISPECIES: recombination regulator RecX [Caballeronia]|uniref:recombination regulator RecX n=1 Tax=Caballeronia TaxID=1827195 RepID=UPI00045EEDAD|nr:MULTISPECIES: recombination regulator RecX [unclassified Caballeronia]MCE4542770.1 recombination regulator RecX [Caballeronia sp. PC1]MCE4568174.1 recombination regulator RecX [Caballeronia sp. CLC5]BAO85499.1 regulatory protein RecX [Burkholderia sp. RPE67]